MGEKWTFDGVMVHGPNNPFHVSYYDAYLGGARVISSCDERGNFGADVLLDFPAGRVFNLVYRNTSLDGKERVRTISYEEAKTMQMRRKEENFPHTIYTN